ncbi:hypothetical protein [Bacteroides zoogleoformans]|uniref:hypothetical protein n=1 Tax=Bacteroides zoogleoformans TaxID=28119 RepID=UPI00248F0CF1|nr:hypothetical protein [Bacteroides zoogleoformans]
MDIIDSPFDMKLDLQKYMFNMSRQMYCVIALLLSVFCLLSCSDKDQYGRELDSITILNDSETFLFDRGESKSVTFELSPKDFIISENQVKLYPTDEFDYISLSGIEYLRSGVYSAIIEDLDGGIEYNKDLSLKVSYNSQGHKQREVLSNSIKVSYTPRIYTFLKLSNEIVFHNNDHSAFTGLLNFNGILYLAFREGVGHRPDNTSDYGVIKIIANDGSGWKESGVIKDPTKDLRDPFLIEIDGRIRVYIGYNTFEGERYQHSGSVYADFDNGQWSNVKPLKHDVPHIIWLWKVRKYLDKYYSVAYLEGEYPVLLSSTDGVDWKTVSIFELEGELSEADMGFIGKFMYVCVRKDKPIGTPSFWGVAKYPFDKFSWKEMDTCVESPELYRLPFANSFLLAGRERHAGSDEVSVSLFSASETGGLKRIAMLDTGLDADKGYPGMTVMNEHLYCSYYTGSFTDTKIKVLKMNIK